MNLTQLLLGILLAVLISLAAYRAHSLSRSGALAAALLGTIVFGLGGLSWAVLLLGFFISSSALSRLFAKRKADLNEKFSKGSQRDAGQVLANGGIAGIFVLAQLAFPESYWPWLAFAGALAAANADTWATELGVLSRSAPRMITNGRRVERGASGAISLTGTLAALGGAGFIGLLAVLAWPHPAAIPTPAQVVLRLLAVLFAGLLGSLFDSLLGATVQAIYTCPTCHKETERHPLHTCGTPTHRIRGLAWLDNDWVNTACTLSGAALALSAALAFAQGLGTAPAPFDVAQIQTRFPLSSPAFAEGQNIPAEYSCEGEERSPELQWRDLPAGTRSLALIAEDPDAPLGTFTHWVVYNLPPETMGLPAGIPAGESILPAGAQGKSSYRQTSYVGPCPPAGAPHRYYFRLFALDLEPTLPSGLDGQQLQNAIQGHILGLGETMGRYQR